MDELNEERREIAEYLRREDAYKKNSRSAVSFLSWLYEIITGTEDFVDDSELLSKLADLIDRPTCTNLGGKDRTDGEGYDFCRSECKFAFNTFGQMPEPSYCPECGAEVVDE